MSTASDKKKSYFGIDVEDVTQALLDLEDFQEELKGGLLDKLFNIPPESDKLFKDALGDNYDRKAAEERIGNVLKRALVDGLPLKDAIGLSAQSMEAFYYLGYSLFQADRLPESHQLFKLLCALNSIEWKYFYALGAVLHKQRNYEKAAEQYLIATALHPQENFPLGHYHSADCYAGLDDLVSAIVALNMAIESCDLQVQEHRHISAKAKDLSEIFQEQLRTQSASQDHGNSPEATQQGEGGDR